MGKSLYCVHRKRSSEYATTPHNLVSDIVWHTISSKLLSVYLFLLRSPKSASRCSIQEY